MDIFKTISDWTRWRPSPGQQAQQQRPGGSPPAASRTGPRWAAWGFVGVVGFLGWAVYTGAADDFVTTLELRVMALVPKVSVLVVLIALIAFLVGWTFLKAPAEHWLSRYGRRLVWIAPAALVAGVALVPVGLAVVTLTQTGAAQMATNFLGTKPAANVCAAMNADAAAPPTPRAAR